VDDQAGESEYLQIARRMRQQIIDGELAVGEPLPSQRLMQAEHGIGRTTYGKAVAELRRQGLVTIRRGQGAWVTTQPAVRVIEVRAGDRVAARAATEAEREEFGTGLLASVLVVTRAAGEAEVYPAAVTVCAVVP